MLLRSATVFLLLLCNDKEVLGPWVNRTRTNVLAGIVVGVLVMLSAILMTSVVFGTLSFGQVLAIVAACVAAAVLTSVFLLARRWLAGQAIPASQRRPAPVDRNNRDTWRMPPLAMLAPVRMSVSRRVAMSAMWVYLAAAIALVIVRVVQIALGG